MRVCYRHGRKEGFCIKTQSGVAVCALLLDTSHSCSHGDQRCKEVEELMGWECEWIWMLLITQCFIVFKSSFGLWILWEIKHSTVKEQHLPFKARAHLTTLSQICTIFSLNLERQKYLNVPPATCSNSKVINSTNSALVFSLAADAKCSTAFST